MSRSTSIQRTARRLAKQQGRSYQAVLNELRAQRTGSLAVRSHVTALVGQQVRYTGVDGEQRTATLMSYNHPVVTFDLGHGTVSKNVTQIAHIAAAAAISAGQESAALIHAFYTTPDAAEAWDVTSWDDFADQEIQDLEIAVRATVALLEDGSYRTGDGGEHVQQYTVADRDLLTAHLRALASVPGHPLHSDNIDDGDDPLSELHELLVDQKTGQPAVWPSTARDYAEHAAVIVRTLDPDARLDEWVDACPDTDTAGSFDVLSTQLGDAAYTVGPTTAVMVACAAAEHLTRSPVSTPSMFVHGACRAAYNHPDGMMPDNITAWLNQHAPVSSPLDESAETNISAADELVIDTQSMTTCRDYAAAAAAVVRALEPAASLDEWVNACPDTDKVLSSSQLLGSLHNAARSVGEPPLVMVAVAVAGHLAENPPVPMIAHIHAACSAAYRYGIPAATITGWQHQHEIPAQ